MMEIEIAGTMAVKPSHPALDVIRKCVKVLDTAITNNDRASIKSVLVDALPELGGRHQAISAPAQT